VHDQRSGGATVHQCGFGRGNLIGNRLGRAATVTRCFAADQVVGLNRGGAFVDRQDLGVPVVLRRTRFFDKSHAAVNLHAQAGDFQTHLSAEAFDQRHHEFIEGLILFAHLGISVVMRRIKGRCRHKRHAAAALGVSAHRHQHAAHIGVVNDGGAAGSRAVHRAALHAVFSVVRGFLVSHLGHRNALHPHRVPGRIHHDEHVLQAVVFLTDELAHRTAVVAKLKHRRRAGFDAQLVLDADAMRVVALAQTAVGMHLEFRHDENTFRRTDHARQHEVNDIARHVVFAVSDVDLCAKDLEAAVGLRLGAGAHHGQVAAGLRLGQVHGACPFARNHFGQIQSLLRFAACGEQRFNRTIGQQRAQRKAHVGTVDHLDARSPYRLGQALAAEVGRVLQALPAAFAKLTECVLETRRRGDHSVLET